MSFKISFETNAILSKISDAPNKEIPISFFLQNFENLKKNNKQINDEISTPENFNINEVTTNEESVSLFYKQGSQKIFISIFGPREMKIREKVNGEHAKLELFTKFALEPQNKMQELINQKIKKFLKYVIMRDSYPKCQITINLNIFNTSTEIDNFSLIPKICNGLMVALCLSGIDLNTLCLVRGYYPKNEESKKYIIFMEQTNNNIFDIETEEPLSIENYNQIINESKESLNNLHNKLIEKIYKKLNY